MNAQTPPPRCTALLQAAMTCTEYSSPVGTDAAALPLPLPPLLSLLLLLLLLPLLLLLLLWH
jgi:hypothetical protein